MSLFGKLAKRFRRPPRIVVTFRRNEEVGGVNVNVAAFTKRAHEYERRMMAVFLLALEKGAVEISREKRKSGIECEAMDKLWQRAIVLGWIVLHEEELK